MGVMTEPEDKTQLKDFDTPVHMACQRCYPVGASDFILTYCGEFRSEKDRLDKRGAIDTKSVCRRCRTGRIAHLRQCRGSVPSMFATTKENTHGNP